MAFFSALEHSVYSVCTFLYSFYLLWSTVMTVAARQRVKHYSWSNLKYIVFNVQSVHMQTLSIQYFLYVLYISALLFSSILQTLNILYTQKSQDWMKATVSHDTPLPQPWIISVFPSATIQVLLLNLAEKPGFLVNSLCPKTPNFCFSALITVGSSQQW